MRKALTLSLICALVAFNPSRVSAESYRTYEEVTFKSSSMKLLEDFTKTDYELAYDAIKGRRFWGW